MTKGIRSQQFGTEEEFATPPLDLGGRIEFLQRRIRQLSWAIVAIAMVFAVCLCLLGVSAWRQSRALTSTRSDMLFGRFVHYDYDSDDYVVPVVNVIQFFHDGYSLQFDKVQYTPQGLLLSGEIGNPNQFSITNLSLTFAIRPYPEKIRDKWAQAGGNMIEWSPDWDLGRGRITIGDVKPGQTARFNLTIPNVKQTSDPVRVAVLFSGEHYSYSQSSHR